MALKIRLRKQGAKNNQKFRLVVIDEQKKRDGAYLEMVGYYQPQQEGNEISIKNDRVEHWLNLGAVLSEKAKCLVKKCAPEVIKNLEEKKRIKRVKEAQKRKKKS